MPTSWLLQEEDPQTGEETWARVKIREIHRDRVIVARALEDLSATSIAKSVDLVGSIELPLPTTRLRPERSAATGTSSDASTGGH